MTPEPTDAERKKARKLVADYMGDEHAPLLAPGLVGVIAEALAEHAEETRKAMIP